MKLKNYLLNQRKSDYIFAPYLAVNDPDWDSSFEIASELFKLGADTIELGLPFTDPVADGPVLQRTFTRVLNNNFNMEDFFSFLKRLNTAFPNKPLLVMGYANVFYQFGFSAIFKKLEKLNVRGVIIPDMLREAKSNLLPPNSEIALIDFITPTTSDKRLKETCKQADGFLYLVSSRGVTGKKNLDFKFLEPICEKIKQETDTPILIGFGIRDKEQAKEAIKIADGFIIGSLIHEIIEENLLKDKKIITESVIERIKKALP